MVRTRQQEGTTTAKTAGDIQLSKGAFVSSIVQSTQDQRWLVVEGAEKSIERAFFCRKEQVKWTQEAGFGLAKVEYYQSTLGVGLALVSYPAPREMRQEDTNPESENLKEEVVGRFSLDRGDQHLRRGAHLLAPRIG